jgi:hypothetical protein
METMEQARLTVPLDLGMKLRAEAMHKRLAPLAAQAFAALGNDPDHDS